MSEKANALFHEGSASVHNVFVEFLNMLDSCESKTMEDDMEMEKFTNAAGRISDLMAHFNDPSLLSWREESYSSILATEINILLHGVQNGNFYSACHQYQIEDCRADIGIVRVDPDDVMKSSVVGFIEVKRNVFGKRERCELFGYVLKEMERRNPQPSSYEQCRYLPYFALGVYTGGVIVYGVFVGQEDVKKSAFETRQERKLVYCKLFEWTLNVYVTSVERLGHCLYALFRCFDFMRDEKPRMVRSLGPAGTQTAIETFHREFINRLEKFLD